MAVTTISVSVFASAWTDYAFSFVLLPFAPFLSNRAKQDLNQDHERHEELMEWIGGSFDPEAFDPAAATKAMKKGLGDWRDEG